jgi:hypothetical protein
MKSLLLERERERLFPKFHKAILNMESKSYGNNNTTQ